MKINIKSRDIEVTPALQDHIEKRLAKFDRLMGGFEEEATVTLKVTKNTHKVEVMIPYLGVLLRAEDSSGDMYASVDGVVKKLERQVSKQKTRLSRQIKSVDHQKAIAELTHSPVDTGELVRRKTFHINPMSVDEAIMQMNLLGHEFFVFANADTNEVNVLYVRHDGNYGVLEPQFN